MEELIGYLFFVIMGGIFILMKNRFLAGFKQFISTTLGLSLPTHIENYIDKLIPLVCLVLGVMAILVGLGELIKKLIDLI